MSRTLKRETVLVTGGTGSIGSALVKKLLEHDVKNVVVFSRDENKHFIMRKEISDDRLKTVVGDVRDYDNIRRVFETFDIDLIYHVAAMKHVTISEEFPIEAVKTNIIGTQNVADLARENKVSRLINISTDKAVHPFNVLGATKLTAERIVANSGYTSVRFGNVACSSGSVIPVMLNDMLLHKRIIVTNPNVTRFMMTIPEAVKLILKATELARGGDIYILKMKAFRLSDLVEVLINNFAPKFGLHPEDIEVRNIGLVNGEKLHEELITPEESDYLYELSGMYVIMKDISKASNINMKNAKITKHSSENAECLSKDEISRAIESYVEQRLSWKNNFFASRLP